MPTFGNITAPIANNSYFDSANGIFTLISNVLTFAGYIAGLIFLIQLIKAGFGYMSAAGDPKKAEAAWAKIYQSLIGIVIVASAFVITSVIGRFIGIDNILAPVIPTPAASN